jgi:ACT domain-containing protein
MVFSPTETALVDLNGLVRTTNLCRTAFHVYQHCLYAAYTPVRDRVITEVMFMLDVVGKFAAQGIRLVKNFVKGQFTVVEP